MPKLIRSPQPAAPPLERDIQHAIREALGLEKDLVLWRNSNAGVETWDPKSGRTRFQHAGLPKGSADLVGILRLPVGVGQFVALEIKKAGGTVSQAQTDWIALVRRFGGFACVVSSVDEARAALQRARRGATE